jgi:hypothetical protein
VLGLIMKYYLPEISTFFQEKEIPPELYSTCWFLTLFATKTDDSELLFQLWEQFILETDPLFPCFFALALLESKQADFMCQDYSSIAAALSRIKISTEPELKRLIARSQHFQAFLPVSTQQLLSNIDPFKLNLTESSTSQLKDKLCLQISPQEAIQRLNPEANICKCGSSCRICLATYQMIVIDCRTVSEQKEGVFPNTAFFYSPNTEIEADLFVKQFLCVKGVYHLAVMGMGTNENSENDDKNIAKLLIKAFLSHGFPYISEVNGGYFACHNFARENRLKISGHSVMTCSVCKLELSEKRRTQSQCILDQQNRSKIEICKGMTVFEVKKYDKKLRGNFPDSLLFVIEDERISITDSEKHTVEQWSLKDLGKVTQVSEANRVLVFYLKNCEEKKMYSFGARRRARECLKTIAAAFSELKNTNTKGLS